MTIEQLEIITLCSLVFTVISISRTICFHRRTKTMEGMTIILEKDLEHAYKLIEKLYSKNTKLWNQYKGLSDWANVKVTWRLIRKRKIKVILFKEKGKYNFKVVTKKGRFIAGGKPKATKRSAMYSAVQATAGNYEVSDRT